jgi:Multicopper oxidase
MYLSLPDLLTLDNPSSVFNSTLINGKGRYPGGPTNVPLAVVNVQQGKRSVLHVCLQMAVQGLTRRTMTATDSV